MFKNMYHSDNVLTAFLASRSLLVFDLSCTIGNNCGYIMYKYGINRSEIRDKTLSLSIFDNDDVSDLIDVLAVQ